MLNIFKNQPTKVKMPRTEEKRSFIYETSVASLGIVDIQGDIAIDKDGRKIAIYEYYFLQPNGINIEDDNENVRQFNILLKKLSCQVKVIYPQKKEKSLDSAIEYFTTRLEIARENRNKEVYVLLKNQLLLLHQYNERKGVFPLLFIELNNAGILKSFCVPENDFLKPTRYKGEALVELVRGLNNGY